MTGGAAATYGFEGGGMQGASMGMDNIVVGGGRRFTRRKSTRRKSTRRKSTRRKSTMRRPVSKKVRQLSKIRRRMGKEMRKDKSKSISKSSRVRKDMLKSLNKKGLTPEQMDYWMNINSSRSSDPSTIRFSNFKSKSFKKK